jgi:hypothetical protein
MTKQPYLRAHLEDFAALRKIVTTGHRDRVEIFAPVDARTAAIRKLRSLGAVHIQNIDVKGRAGRNPSLKEKQVGRVP